MLEGEKISTVHVVNVFSFEANFEMFLNFSQIDTIIIFNDPSCCNRAVSSECCKAKTKVIAKANKRNLNDLMNQREPLEKIHVTLGRTHVIKS